MDQAAVFAALAQAPQASDVKLRRLHRVRMFRDGFLTVPAEVADGDTVRSVFLFSDPGDAARRWAGIRALMRAVREPEPVYFAPGPIPEAPAADPTRPFDYPLLSRPEKEPVGEFYMWWKDGETTWEDAAARGSIRRFYAAVNGFESYHFASILRNIDAADAETLRARLPEESVSLPAELPGELTFYITFSQEKGIQFKLPLDTPAERRDTFWKHLAAAAEAMRGILEQHGVPRDGEGDSEAFRWFSFADSIRSPGEMLRFGGLHVTS